MQVLPQGCFLLTWDLNKNVLLTDPEVVWSGGFLHTIRGPSRCCSCSQVTLKGKFRQVNLIGTGSVKCILLLTHNLSLTSVTAVQQAPLCRACVIMCINWIHQIYTVIGGYFYSPDIFVFMLLLLLRTNFIDWEHNRIPRHGPSLLWSLSHVFIRHERLRMHRIVHVTWSTWARIRITSPTVSFI